MTNQNLLSRIKPSWTDPADVKGGSPFHLVARRLLPLNARWALAEFAFNAKTQLRLASDLAREIGWGSVAKIRLAQAKKSVTNARRVCKLNIPGYPHPLFYREGTSDPFVIEQVFARREYECVINESNVRTIIDCGANVGYTSAYLLNNYPAARIAVIEPDSGNLEICKRNLAPYEGRVTFIHAGVWSEAGPMTLDRSGEEWAFVARPAKPGEQVEFEAVTINDIFAKAGFEKVDLLKIDIEGAEEVVFEKPIDWLNKARNLVIEIHGPKCESVVLSALNGKSYQKSMSGELTVFREIQNCDRPIAGRQS